MEQQQVKRTTPKQETTAEETEPVETKAAKKTPEELKKDMDDLLDDIEEVLEENAEAMIAGYIQKGGQAVWVKLRNLGTVLNVDWRLRPLV